MTGGGGDGGQRHRRAPRHRAHHLHRLARGGLGHPGAGAPQEGRARARQQRPGDHRARRRLGDGGRQDLGRGVQPRRPVVHLHPAGVRAPVDVADDFVAALAERGRRARRSATRSTRPPTSPRSSPPTSATGSSPGSTRPSPRRRDGRRRRRGRRRRLLKPTVLTDVTPDMKVCARGGVRPGRRRAGLRRPRRGARRWPTAPTTGCRPAIFTARPRRRRCGGPHARLRRRARQRGADVAGRPDALRRRERQRQHQEGPAYAVREMTEARLVVIST